ncbi:alpha-N-arabinofuranosidase [Sphingomonas sp.]|jgi:alpha-N-arabinofuranosidase|uniref:arabinosylfuranosidase ArfA n=1 Tax=Sphingomonas sp. TaxID=28214 RepID=UPI002D7E8673|nr:alpha-N-arabinofuranosidase [Sphingomonas sp.]HEU0045896.1 alpha-N-arabinofuranosidase [Sphingomonas sp.]
MIKASVIADVDFSVAPLDRRIFGTFVEHMGRCVYGGIYEPGHPTAGADGLRGDVLELTRELGPTIVRYPGGNFLSGYNWEDGVGPKDQRPVRLDLAWGSTETNQFGTNEFIDWCRIVDVEPMFAVNMGTRGPDEAREFIEYCNHPGGTALSDLRRAHGYEKPHDIKFWCLGNEMDGPWQICKKTATEYGRAAQETGKLMRMVSDGLSLAACGSSYRAMPTYAAWEYEVLEHCFEEVDYISLHQYFRNDDDDIAKFMSALDDLDGFIKSVAAIADAVAAKRRSTKRIMLSLDEWNVWYKAHGPSDLKKPGWPQAPDLLDEIYNAEDALIVGGALIVLMNNADRVKVACLAQLVNVLGAIHTDTGGPAWRQTIFHPFALASRHAHGNTLRTQSDGPMVTTLAHGDVPVLMHAVVHDPQTGRATIFALNRSADAPMELTVALRGAGEAMTLELATELHHHDLKAINDRDNPDRVTPATNDTARVSGHRITAELKPLSWNVIVVATR